jgi:hypothetical protein
MNEVRWGLKPVPEILHTCFHVGINMNLSDKKTETTVSAAVEGIGGRCVWSEEVRKELCPNTISKQLFTVYNCLIRYSVVDGTLLTIVQSAGAI